jgi:hypothetical protein
MPTDREQLAVAQVDMIWAMGMHPAADGTGRWYALAAP